MNFPVSEALTPLLLAASLAALILSGVAMVLWGRQLLATKAILLRGAIVPPLVFVLVAVIFGWRELLDGGIHFWMKGWIGGTDVAGSLTAGLISDPIGLSAAALLLVLVSLYLVAVDPLWNPNRAERACASFAFNAAGCILSWQSLTPWIGLFGVALCGLGGFVGMGTSWHSEEDGLIATYFAYERAFLIMLAMLGACLFLYKQSPEVWRPGGEALAALSLREIGGAVLMVLAIVAQSDVFPIFGGLAAPARSGRFFTLQFLPFWALFGMLLRMEGPLRAAGVFPHFSWFAVSAAFITTIYGLMNESWKLSFAAWNATGFCFSVAVLSAVGPMAGVASLLGFSLPGIAISMLMQQPGGGRTSRAIVFVAFAFGTGMFGSLWGASMSLWMSHYDAVPGVLAAIALSWMAFVCLGWRLAWKAPVTDGEAGLNALIPAGLLTLISLGVVWTGSASGGALSGIGVEDSLFHSPLKLAFGIATDSAVGTNGTDVTSLALMGAALVLGILLAYWTSAGSRDSFAAFAQKAPGVTGAVRGGFGIPRLARATRFRAIQVGDVMIQWVDRKVWEAWIPNGLQRGAFWLNRGTIRAEERVWPAFCEASDRIVAVPGKLLQLLQNGDVRWYVFFALASVLAVAAHLFLRGAAA